jgi:hypothetical protein
LHTDNEAFPGYLAFARLVKEKVTACGGTFVSDATYTNTLSIGIDGNRPNYATENMAQFSNDGVTTVIWPGGWEEKQTQAAAAIGYRPEWVMAGDQQIEGYDIGQFQEQSVWSHAWVVTDITKRTTFTEDLCFVALRDADPNFPQQDAEYACPLFGTYESLRQLFTGIQVAGPRLGPTSMDKGYRAIPAIDSTDPRVPSCFYLPGDFTCVKDAIPMWWDAQSRSRNNHVGCWRMPEGAHRYRAEKWPQGDVTAQKSEADVCNGYAASLFGA